MLDLLWSIMQDESGVVPQEIVIQAHQAVIECVKIPAFKPFR